MTFLDFGLVKRYEPEEVALFEELIRTMVLEHDIARFRAVLEAHDVLRRDAPFGNDDVREYFGHFYEFVMEDRVVTLSPEYASETRAADLRPLRSVRARRQGLERAAGVRDHASASTSGCTRCSAVCGATANFRRIAEELWPIVDGPPSTPMGEAEAAWLATR